MYMKKASVEIVVVVVEATDLKLEFKSSESGRALRCLVLDSLTVTFTVLQAERLLSLMNRVLI